MRLRAHAKINVDLRVQPARPDGYHDLSTVFQTVALHDEVSLEAWDGPLVLTSDDERVPTGDGNLCIKAVRALWEECGRPGTPSGFRLHLQKRVPMEAGLGGGSADAAAVLAGLARFWRLESGDPRLRRAALAVGSDVPFFLVGGTALGQGRGEVLTPLADLSPTEVVIVKPPFGVSTAAAYRWFDELLENVGAGQMAASILGGRVLSGCRNQLERPVVIRHPEIGQMTSQLRATGARLAAMSGSGSAVFGLFDTASEADAAARALDGGRLWVARTRLVGRAEYLAGLVLEA